MSDLPSTSWTQQLKDYIPLNTNDDDIKMPVFDLGQRRIILNHSYFLRQKGNEMLEEGTSMRNRGIDYLTESKKYDEKAQQLLDISQEKHKEMDKQPESLDDTFIYINSDDDEDFLINSNKSKYAQECRERCKGSLEKEYCQEVNCQRCLFKGWSEPYSHATSSTADAPAAPAVSAAFAASATTDAPAAPAAFAATAAAPAAPTASTTSTPPPSLPSTPTTSTLSAALKRKQDIDEDKNSKVQKIANDRGENTEERENPSSSSGHEETASINHNSRDRNNTVIANMKGFFLFSPNGQKKMKVYAFTCNQNNSEISKTLAKKLDLPIFSPNIRIKDETKPNILHQEIGLKEFTVATFASNDTSVITTVKDHIFWINPDLDETNDDEAFLPIIFGKDLHFFFEKKTLINSETSPINLEAYTNDFGHFISFLDY